MEKKEEKMCGKEEAVPHCLVLPYPIQGHINPMLQFSKRLQHKGIKVTLALTKYVNTNIQINSTNSIQIETISDGFDLNGPDEAANDITGYLSRFEQVGSQTLAMALDKLHLQGFPVDCIIYDGFLPWGLSVAKKYGKIAAIFFTQSAAVDHIYYHVNKGLFKVPNNGENVLIQGHPPLNIEDMPSFISHPQIYPPLNHMVLNQFLNIENVDWVFCNTFFELEKEVVDLMAKDLPLRTVGPTIPSFYLDKKLPDDRDYGASVYKPNSSECMNWLNSRETASVVYVSFGSLAKLDLEQMEELARGLRDCNEYILWVVRSSEVDKLPKFVTEEKNPKELIVSWCQQLDVLSHKAVGCFVTHCGWNSTLEALSLGVPMVAMPQWTDQSTNAKYVVDVWKMGTRVKPDENGIVRSKEIMRCINEIMKGEKGKDIRNNADKWKELAVKAVDIGGSSDKNIDEFISKLLR